mgnify:CR=1 FL=1
MATFSDIPFGLLKETTYGTPVTVSRWFEHTGETFDYNKNIVEPKALRVGSRMGMTTRRVITTSDAGGDVTIPCLSKGMGTMWEQCMGSGTSTLVSGSTYQQLFTFADVMPSATYQIGIPRYDGTTTPFTYSGGMVDSFELEFANGEVAMLKVTVDARDVTTATALASPTMPAASANLFHFANGSLSTGTVTAPTTWSVEEPVTTALASSVTPLTNVRSGNIKVSHNLNTGGYNFGASGKKRKPSTGLREVTGSLTVEFDSATFTDAVLSETPMTLVLTFTGGALSEGTETLQVVLSEIKLDGKMPTSNGGDEITVDMSFTAGENGVAAQGMWIVTRTADVAL